MRDSTGQIICGNCLDVMAEMEENSIDTIITDPPYELSFMGKDWDKNGVSFQSGIWAAVLRIAKPGALLLAFGGTRTWHRLACAIEDAGWEIRDTMLWMFGGGFPKSHNIANAVDKKHGAPDRRHRIATASRFSPDGLFEPDGEDLPPYMARTEYGVAWEGHGTALKPAWEPIILAMKPIDGTFAQNAEKWGVAGLWIDGARIAHLESNTCRSRYKAGLSEEQMTGLGGIRYAHINYGKYAEENSRRADSGRWPANVLLQHHPECVEVGKTKVRGVKRLSAGDSEGRGIYGRGFPRGDLRVVGYTEADGFEEVVAYNCHPDCPVGILDGMSSSKSPVSYRRMVKSENRTAYSPGIGEPAGKDSLNYGDSGGASRFFYTAKAPRRERFFLCRDCDDVFPAEMRDAHKHGHVDAKGRRTWGHLIYHPTQKPIELMEYLCTLTKTPTGGIVLDPFAGTGTTCLAARNVGRPFIGIEFESDYCRIAQRRLTREQLELPFGRGTDAAKS